MIRESILAEAAEAAAAAIRAEAATAHQATPIDAAEVEALVATLPDRAREGKAGDVGAISFVFTEWDPRNRHAAEVAGAARDRLVALGLNPTVEMIKVGLREVPGRLVIDYADLDAAAQLEAGLRVRWIEDARVLWTEIGGDGAEVREVVTRSGRSAARFSTRALAVPINDASPFRLDFLMRARERELDVEAYWLRRTEEAVAFVEGAIRPVRWTIAALEEAWARIGHGAVTYSYGLYEQGQLRQCAVVEFRRGDQALKFAIEDVREYRAEDLAKMVTEEGSWARTEGSGPPAMPDRADPRLVAGDARDRALGMRGGGRRDDFKYVAPPGPPRIHLGDDAPVPMPCDLAHATPQQPKGAEIDTTRMTPVQAMAHAAERKPKPAATPRPKKHTTDGP